MYDDIHDLLSTKRVFQSHQGHCLTLSRAAAPRRSRRLSRIVVGARGSCSRRPRAVCSANHRARACLSDGAARRHGEWSETSRATWGVTIVTEVPRGCRATPLGIGAGRLYVIHEVAYAEKRFKRLRAICETNITN